MRLPSPIPLPGQEPTELRTTLREGRAALSREYQTRPSASRFLRQHSTLVDGVLTELWRHGGFAADSALVAVGGFGRRELYPHSDVDVLILLRHEANPALAEKLERLIGTFWDVGLEIGHSVRTIDACIDESRDVTVATNLLESRLIVGDRKLYEDFRRAFLRELDAHRFVEAKILEQEQRHIRFQDSAYSLEPNLKENPGGLRDLQNCLWLSEALGVGHNWTDLARAGLLTEPEVRLIRRLDNSLRDLRIRLHHLARRREDRLLFDFQDTLAKEIGCRGQRTRAASEVLMQRYYRTAKLVRMMNHILLLDLRERISEQPLAPATSINARFAIRRNLLELAEPDVFDRFPGAILEAFYLMQERSDLDEMGPTTVRALVRAVPRIDAAFRNSHENRARFMDILRAPHGLTRTLRRMNLYGVLGRYLPAFGRIVGQMQHDLFHVYTVDEHILFVVRNLRRFTSAEFAHEYPLCSRLIANFEHPEVLYIAGLFHDIAKGRGGDHSALGARDARQFCLDHEIPEEDTELIVWLVEQHLTMSATAQKQDLSDPDVIAGFADKVGATRRLTALYLLTVADVRGTSPKVWNAWKGKLLEDLFRATQRVLTGGAISHDRQMEVRQEEALRLLAHEALPKEAQRQFWQAVDDSYFLRYGVQEIAWHTRMLYQSVHTEASVVRARVAPHGEGIQVLIYTPDREDLFSRICGFFDRVNYNIVEAKIYTTPHNYALDTFLVLDIGNAADHYRDLLSFIEYELARRIDEKGPPEAPISGRVSRQVKHFPIEPKVGILPDERGQYHILSITAGDRPGLLLRIAQVLTKHQIRVHTAKIATLGDRAEDTFLIHAADTQLSKLKAVLELETDLVAALQP
jgi:[protein-PII] uridylyltransferase